MRKQGIVTGVLLLFVSLGCAQEASPTPQDMAAMLAKAKEFTQPGKMHEVLNRLIGDWESETRIFMAGQATPAEKGSMSCDWLKAKRWVQCRSKGLLMGRPLNGFSVMGYDNFKKSFVATSISDFDTAMNRAEGDLDQHGKTLLLYGTIDEYLTGEHDKMVKLVYRFHSASKITMEIHDLPIGETNTKVIEINYTRSN